MKLTREAVQQVDRELQEAIADGEDVREWTPEAVEELLMRSDHIGEQYEFSPGDMIETIKDWQRENPPS